MKKKFNLVFLLSLLLSQAMNVNASDSPIELGTIKISPWGEYAGRPDRKGPIYEMTSKISKESGIPFHNNNIYGLVRLVDGLKKGKIDMALFFRRKEALPEGIECIATIDSQDILVLTNFEANCLKDLEGKTIAYYRGANYNPAFMANEKIKKIEVQSYEAGIKMCQAGRVDGVLGPSFGLAHALDSFQVKDKITNYIILSTEDIGVYISTKSPRLNKDKIERMKKTCERYYKDQEFRKVATRYGLGKYLNGHGIKDTLRWGRKVPKTISHIQLESLQDEIYRTRERLKKSFQGQDLQERLQILEDLSHSEFGKFLILNKGLNGYWTDYAVYRWPKFLRGKTKIQNETESFILNQMPIFVATQERFNIFQRELQSLVKEGVHMASMPCGYMSDLLNLDYSKVNNFRLVGIDVDPVSIEEAKKQAQQLGISSKTEYMLKDAWSVDAKEKYDVLTSNGLNLYVKEEKKAQKLYKNFYEILKPGGVLIGSFIQPPRAKYEHISEDILKKSKAILLDVIGVRWNSRPTTKEQMKASLEKVGFKKVEFFSDKNDLFPTVRATK